MLRCLTLKMSLSLGSLDLLIDNWATNILDKSQKEFYYSYE